MLSFLLAQYPSFYVYLPDHHHHHHHHGDRTIIERVLLKGHTMEKCKSSCETVESRVAVRLIEDNTSNNIAHTEPKILYGNI